MLHGHGEFRYTGSLRCISAAAGAGKGPFGTVGGGHGGTECGGRRYPAQCGHAGQGGKVRFPE